MDSCDILIVGGGPAGSTCAWTLAERGYDVVVLDRQVFPRDKPCAGWITPQVLAELKIDPHEYREGRVMEPIAGFRTGWIGGPAADITYPSPVSYGIRRCEFDTYLLNRSGARRVLGSGLKTLEYTGERWIANGVISAPMLVGAGGHFCPVARHLGARPGTETAVAAQEVEFEAPGSDVRPGVPEIYFCRDLLGYGWCFQKGPFLNVGLGRLDKHALSAHLDGFVEFLETEGRVRSGIPAKRAGHAYLLRDTSARTVVADGVLLVGDAAGLAYSQSGEGIRPAVESGLLAANVIAEARGDYRRERLSLYSDLLKQRFGDPHQSRFGAWIPGAMMGAAARGLMRIPWLTRHVVINRWFLHSTEAPLVPSETAAGTSLESVSNR